jgi:hypothetical protein
MRALIEYRGNRGTTQACLEALAFFLQEMRERGKAVICSGPKDTNGARSHALVLLVDDQPRAIIPDGFASGYLGTGPWGFEKAIQLLDSCKWDINEAELSESVFRRVADGEATRAELERIVSGNLHPISQVFLYLTRDALSAEVIAESWNHVRVSIPLPIIDKRILDLALSFWDDPDAALNRGYRRLEDRIRERCGFNSSADFGARLFSRAFGNDKSPLAWKYDDEYSTNHTQTFVGTFAGFRNRRMHREPVHESDASLLRELMQLNTLFALELELVVRDPDSSDKSNVFS